MEKVRKIINLYVDDLRDCPEGFVVARSYEEAIDVLDKKTVDILSLDHDLGEDAYGRTRKSGYDLVKYFCENGIRVNAIYIHTDNPVGRDNMYKTLLASQSRGFIDKKIKIYYYPFIENKYTIN